MPKKIILTLLLMSLAGYGLADSYYEMGTQYLNNYQYTSAITQFRNSLRQYPTDYNSRVGLINSYLARATYYNNTSKDYQKALNDLRSALFYLKYYEDGAVNASLQSATEKTENNINELLSVLKPNTTPDGLLLTAKQLRYQSELPSSFLVYQQLMGTKYDKEATIASGDILKILRNPSRAIVYYNKALKSEPNNYDLLTKIGECYQEAGDTNAAADAFNKVMQNSKNSDVALSGLEKIWRVQVAKTPSDAEAHSNLGVIYQQKGNYEDALIEYQKAEKLNPKNLNTKLNMGTLYQAQKKYDEAITLYDKVLFTDAGNVQARKYKAQCLKALGKNEEAMIEFKRVLAFSPNEKDINNEILSMATSASNPQEFMNILNETMNTPEEKANALYNFAYDLHKNKKYEEAKTYYNEALKLNQSIPDAYLNLSDVYLQQNDEKSAIDILTKGLALYPLNTQMNDRLKNMKLAASQQALEQAGKALLAGKYDEALTMYKSVSPETSDSLQGIALAYQSKGNLDDAINYYKKAYEIDSRNAEIPYYIASAYVSKDDANNAKIYLNKALALNPNHQNSKNLMKYLSEEDTQKTIDKALDLYNSKNYQDAYTLLTEAIIKSPSTSVLYYYRGMVLDEQKKYALAIEDYKKSANLDSQFDLAYYSIGVDYDNLKNYKSAYQYYKKYLSVTNEQNEYTQFTTKRIEELQKYVPNIAQTK